MNHGNAPSDKVQRYIEDFINRYQQGPQQISEQEAADRYRQVASQLPPTTTYRRPRRPSPACRLRSGCSSGGTWAKRHNGKATTSLISTKTA
jgi:hypothetical protein